MKFICILSFFLMLSCATNRIDNRDVSSTWDMENFKGDMKYLDVHNEARPIRFGVFPVPQYELSGIPFQGSGYNISLDEIKFRENRIACVSFYYKDKKGNNVFFTLLVLTDITNYLQKNGLTSFEISSRNHPSYVGQGYIETKNNRVDFVSFKSGQHNSFALVNMRLFNLKHGNVILIAPQKDGSLRSKQLGSPTIRKSLSNWNEEIISMVEKNTDVHAFFSYDGNI